MAYSQRRRSSSRASFWNFNRICLLAVVIVCWSISVLALWFGFRETGNIGQAFGGIVCPMFFMLIPLAILCSAALKRRRKNPAPAVMRPGVAAKPGFRDVSVTSDQDLPGVCIRCGETTKRVTPLRYAGSHTEASPYDWSRINPLLMIFLVWKFAFYVIMTKVCEMVEKRWKRRKAHAKGVLFRIPHCKGCASHHPIIQRHFDFHGRSMILEAHPEFHRRLAE